MSEVNEGARLVDNSKARSVCEACTVAGMGICAAAQATTGPPWMHVRQQVTTTPLKSIWNLHLLTVTELGSVRRHVFYTEKHSAAQSFVKDVEDLGLHDSTTDRCRVSAKTGLPDDIKMPAWLKAYNKVPHSVTAYTGFGKGISHALYASRRA